jgi:Flp pilus assembly protein TadG
MHNQTRSFLTSALRLLKRLRKQDGVAAIEFALIVGFASVSIINAADIAIYARDRMEVESATEMGAQAAYKTCDTHHLPATVNCAGLNAAITTAVQATSLGTGVTLQAGSPTEGYYCVNSSGALVLVHDTSSKPADCTSVGTPANTPGDYIKVQTTFAYSAMFPGSVASVFPTHILKTAYMRLH